MCSSDLSPLGSFKFLKLPSGELAKLADLQRKEELKRELGDRKSVV